MSQYRDAPTDVMMEGIKKRRESHHDTIYCNKAQADALKREVNSPGLLSSNIDSLRIFGLDVEVLPIQKPIICQKGDVFDLAKEYKNGEL